jgi:hydrogenase small subunit
LPQVVPCVQLTRRRFLKSSAFTAALFTLDWALPGCSSNNASSVGPAGSYSASGRPAPEEDSDARTALIWIEAGICTGCAGSLLSNANPTIEALLPDLRLEFQETLMDGTGATALDHLYAVAAELGGKYVLIVDGSVSLGDKASMTVLGSNGSGEDITAESLVRQLAASAAAVIALGTCASFGGIPAAGSNPGGHASITSLVSTTVPLVRLPGCPPNPGWIVETLAALLSQGVSGLSLDSSGRPTAIYGQLIHDVCPRREAYEAGRYATAPGDPTNCLITVGCKGPSTYADCPSRLWNGTTSCIGANHPCIGCASPGFPDARTDAGTEGEVAASPFYYDP